MSEPGKLVVGCLGVLIGLALGFAGLTYVMQLTGGALFDRQLLGLLVAVGLVGGGAALFGWLALTVPDMIERHRKRTARKEKKRSRR